MYLPKYFLFLEYPPTVFGPIFLFLPVATVSSQKEKVAKIVFRNSGFHPPRNVELDAICCVMVEYVRRVSRTISRVDGIAIVGCN